MLYSKTVIIIMLSGLFLLALLTFAELPPIFYDFADKTSVYIQEGVVDTGVTNQVTAILFDYRGFDTLGEATVIFAAALIISYFAPRKKAPMLGVRLGVLVRYGVASILPFILIFGMYIIFFGHISPGGGFTGGVVLASIVIIFDITFGFGQGRVHLLSRDTKKSIESIGLVMFILIGIWGVFFEGAFLANSSTLVEKGTLGEFVSGGMIPILNIASGLKVGAGLAIIFNNLVKEN